MLCSELARLEEEAHGAHAARGALEDEAARAGSELRARMREARRGRQQALSLAKQVTSLEVALVEVRARAARGALGRPSRPAHGRRPSSVRALPFPPRLAPARARRQARDGASEGSARLSAAATGLGSAAASTF